MKQNRKLNLILRLLNYDYPQKRTVKCALFYLLKYENNNNPNVHLFLLNLLTPKTKILIGRLEIRLASILVILINQLHLLQVQSREVVVLQLVTQRAVYCFITLMTRMHCLAVVYIMAMFMIKIIK